jgi:hypothetical protein
LRITNYILVFVIRYSLFSGRAGYELVIDSLGAGLYCLAAGGRVLDLHGGAAAKALDVRYQKILALAEETDQATIVQLLTRLEARESQVVEMEAAMTRLLQALPHTIQGYGVVRYDAFENVAGDQSFSLALVDMEGSGVMLSGLHSRADTRVYAKALKQWQAGMASARRSSRRWAWRGRCLRERPIRRMVDKRHSLVMIKPNRQYEPTFKSGRG